MASPLRPLQLVHAPTFVALLAVAACSDATTPRSMATSDRAASKTVLLAYTHPAGTVYATTAIPSPYVGAYTVAVNDAANQIYVGMAAATGSPAVALFHPPSANIVSVTPSLANNAYNFSDLKFAPDGASLHALNSNGQGGFAEYLGSAGWISLNGVPGSPITAVYTDSTKLNPYPGYVSFVYVSSARYGGTPAHFSELLYRFLEWPAYGGHGLTVEDSVEVGQDGQMPRVIAAPNSADTVFYVSSDSAVSFGSVATVVSSATNLHKLTVTHRTKLSGPMQDLVASADGTRLYVLANTGSNGAGTLYTLAEPAGTLLSTLSLGTLTGNSIAQTPDGAQLWISQTNSLRQGVVTIVDRSTLKVVKTINVGGVPGQIGFANGGQRAIIPNNGSFSTPPYVSLIQ